MKNIRLMKGIHQIMKSGILTCRIPTASSPSKSIALWKLFGPFETLMVSRKRGPKSRNSKVFCSFPPLGGRWPRVVWRVATNITFLIGAVALRNHCRRLCLPGLCISAAFATREVIRHLVPFVVINSPLDFDKTALPEATVGRCSLQDGCVQVCSVCHDAFCRKAPMRWATTIRRF